jgi:hypothetical protein
MPVDERQWLTSTEPQALICLFQTSGALLLVGCGET